jgi:hypothetical protein
MAGVYTLDDLRSAGACRAALTRPTPIRIVAGVSSARPSSSSSAPLAVVTGASSGIGLAIAEALAERGYRTVLLARRLDYLLSHAERLSHRALSTAIALDVGSAKAIEDTFARLLADHGPPAVLVNAAGYGHYMRFTEHTVEEHERLMRVNYFGTLYCTRAVLPAMLEAGRGHVINVASIAAKVGPWGHSGYAAAKAAVIALTESLAGEHLDDPVEFTYVIPGIVKTEFFDRPSYGKIKGGNLKRAIPAARLARTVMKAIDRPRLQLYVPAHYRMLDVLRTLSLKWTHRLVARSSEPEG